MSIILFVVNVPFQANAKITLDELHTVEMENLDVLFIIVDDFNQANLRPVLRKYQQHVSCLTLSLTF